MLSVPPVQYPACGTPFHGAVVITETRLSVNLYFTKAARPMAATVSGSHSKVKPNTMFTARQKISCTSDMYPFPGAWRSVHKAGSLGQTHIITAAHMTRRHLLPARSPRCGAVSRNTSSFPQSFSFPPETAVLAGGVDHSRERAALDMLMHTKRCTHQQWFEHCTGFGSVWYTVCT